MSRTHTRHRPSGLSVWLVASLLAVVSLLATACGGGKGGRPAVTLTGLAITPPAPSVALGFAQALVATGTYSDMTTRDLTTSVVWNSGNAAVATVSNVDGSRGQVATVAAGSVQITATDPASGVVAATALTVTSAVLVALEVTPSPAAVAQGYSRQFTATGLFSDSTTQDLTNAVTWASSNAAVATVSNAVGAQGLATGVDVGSATISASHAAAGLQAATTLTVTAAVLVAIGVTPATPSLALGYEQQFTATGTFSDNTTKDLTASVIWNSSDVGVATIGNVVGSQGLATSAAAGTTTITATHPGSSVVGSTTLTVTTAALVAIGVTPALPSVALGYTQQFVATGTFSDNTTQDLTTAVTWSSTATATATISNAVGTQGLATSAAVGTTTITATAAGTSVTGATTFTVTPAVLLSIAVTPASPSVALGYAQQFVATGTFSDNTTQDLTTAVTWNSSTVATATISNALGTQGLATSAAVGTTTVTATDAGTSVAGATAFTVTPAVLVAIGVTPALPSLALGYEQQFVATGTFSDNTTQDLTTAVAWSSSTVATATISNAVGTQGLATSAAVGTTTIAATDAATSIVGATTFTVTPPVLVAIGVTPATPSLALGYAQQFVATGTFSDNTTQDLTTAVAWSSSATAAATISNAVGTQGLATSAAVGVTTITATDAGTSLVGSATLAVTPAVLVAIDVMPTTASLALGYEQQFTATGTFSDNRTEDITDAVTWSSSVTAAATISNALGTQGLATSAAIGATTITAIDPGTSLADTAVLTVTAAALVSIDVTPTAPAVALGYAQQFVATGTFSDNTTSDITAVVTWSSSAAGVATISNASGTQGLASSVATGSTTIAAVDPATSLVGSTTLTVTPAVLLSVAVTPAIPSLALGYGQQFTATGTFSDNTTQDLTAVVTWSSAAAATATVSNATGTQGLATSVAAGTTTITATEPATSVAGSTVLTVTPAVLVSLAVTPATPAAALGYDQQFAATGTFSDNTTQDLTAVVTWSSSATGVATISNALGSPGLATSVAPGATTITATDVSTSIAGSTSFTVTSAVLVAIAVTPAAPSTALGYDQQFTAIGTFSDNTTQDLTTAVTWSSSATGVATISNALGSAGLASTLAGGTTTITATDSGSSLAGATTWTVTPAVLLSIAVAPASPSLALGYTQQFTATGTFSDNTTQDLTAVVTWSSSTPGVATISNAVGTHGLATSLATGPTTITATEAATSVAGATSLTVSPAVLVAIVVAPASPSIAAGYTQQFTATGTFSDNSTLDLTAAVTWSSANQAAATISNASGSEGLASSAGTGVTTITATHPGTSIASSTTLTVTSAVLVALQVAPAASTVALGSVQQFTATGTFSDNSTQDLTAAVVWSSSNTAVATISNTSGSEGLVSSVVQGATTITATHLPSSLVASTGLTIGDPIVLRSTRTATGTSSVLALAVAVPTGTVAGDVMLAAITVRPSSATITAPSGWTLIRRSDNLPPNPSSLLIYSRVAAANEPTSHTWTFSNSQGSAGCMLTFQGVNTGTIVDVEDGHGTPSSLTHATPSVTTTTNNTMVVTFHTMTSSVTWTPPVGMTEVVDIASDVVPINGGVSLTASWQFQGAAGSTGARTATGSNNPGTGNACIVALRD